ncbi:MAG: TlpA family protein disulfide reductase [Lachnospiraceae bacterium]|nr:TlpA family protein disulfide reductase [Lachnospiraceae bacterium]
MGSDNKEKRRRKILLSTGRVILVSLVLTAAAMMFSFTYASGKLLDNVEKTTSSDAFKVMETNTFTGEPFTIDDVKKSGITVVNVWETTCDPCIREMPYLDKASKDYDPEKVQIVGLCADVVSADMTVDEKIFSDAKKIVEDTGASYTQIYADENLASFLAINKVATPITFVLDNEGNIIKTSLGALSYEGWIQFIDSMLDGSGN